MLGLAHPTPTRPSAPSEIALLSRFAHLASLALESARLYAAAQDELQERRRAEHALREAELRYRTLVEHLPLVTYISPPDESVGNVYVSPQVEKLLGYPAEEWIVEPRPAATRPSTRTTSSGSSPTPTRLRETGEPLRSEYRYIAADGRVVWVLDETILVRDEHGHAALGAGLPRRHHREQARRGDERALAAAEQEARAIAEAAQRDLAAQNERLRELDRLKDEFIALVSHELRTPLTSIRGYTELLLDGEAGELTDDQRQFLGVVERNSHRLLHLVGDLLFLAQVEAGKLDARASAPLDLGAVASESVETARPQAEAKGITLTLATGPVPPIAGDRARIAQLLDNLVSNAIKFTPEGGRVDVRVRAVQERRRSSRCATAASASPPTSRSSSSSASSARRPRPSRRSRAPGSGLAISKAIVEAHAGRITVASEEGAGTTFRVALPLHQPGGGRRAREVAS